MKRSKPVCGAIVLLFLAVLAWSSPAGAQTVPFKVYITELWQLDTNVDPVIGVIGDYYAQGDDQRRRAGQQERVQR